MTEHIKLNTTHSDVAIIIPSRIGSTRLSHKPLVKIGEELTMIEHVIVQAKKTGLKNIYIATDSSLISDVVSKSGVKPIMTGSNIPSGTDRVYKAYTAIPNKEEIKYVVNLQGDMPFINPQVLLTVIESLKNSQFEIMTPVTKVNQTVADSISNVKVIADANNKALYFSRSLIPHNSSQFLYHIGVYGFRADTLEKFVNLPHTSLEQIENLEQLRALHHGMSIGICYVDDVPISIDTAEDLQKAQEFYNTLSS